MGRNLVDIGNKAYSARVNKRIKQEHLSEYLGIAQSSYSRFENGHYDMPFSKIIKLCELLEISITWLMGESDNILTDKEKMELEEYKRYLINKRK